MVVTELVYAPIRNAAARVAAPLSGEADFIQDVPAQDLRRVADADGLVVRTAPQNRVIFFGMKQGDDDLARTMPRAPTRSPTCASAGPCRWRWTARPSGRW